MRQQGMNKYVSFLLDSTQLNFIFINVLGMNPDISNIGSLLNNSVAPNVTLKRSTGSDSPLSPDYINNLVHHQRSPSFHGKNVGQQIYLKYKTIFVCSLSK